MLKSLLSVFFGKFMVDNFRDTVQRTKRQAVCGAVIGFGLLYTLFFGCIAVFCWLQPLTSSVIAAVIIAVLWLIAALVGALCMKISSEKREKNRSFALSDEQKKLVTNSALAAAPALLAMGKKSYKKIGLLAVLAGGAYVAYSLLRSDDAEQ